MDKAQRKTVVKKAVEPAPVDGPTVFMVDDDEAVRASVQFLLESIGLRIQSFASGEEFLRSWKPAMRGCLLLDVRMPKMSGLELQEKLQQMDAMLPVIILTGHADVPMAVRAMRSGAFDFIEKPCNDQVLVERIQQAIAFDSNSRIDDQRLQDIKARLATLSEREREVLELVVAGMLNKEMAKALSLSIKTVEVHRAHVMEKMGVKCLADLVRNAMLVGID
jgi:FixJ family two-component response regulator